MVRFLFCLVLLSVALENSNAADAPPACASVLIKDCTNAITVAGLNGNDTPEAHGILGADKDLMTATSVSQGRYNAAKSLCEDRAKYCEQQCKATNPSDPKTVEEAKTFSNECKQAIASLVAKVKDEDKFLSSLGSTLGDAASSIFSSNTAKLLGIGGAAGLAGYMMGKSAGKAQQKKEDLDAQRALLNKQYGALHPDGSINCAMSDAYQFSDCDQYNMGACANVTANASPSVPVTALPTLAGSLPLAGPALSAVPMGVNCNAFSERFCSTTVTPNVAFSNQMVANGPIFQVNKGGTGAGLGSNYCTNIQAAGYCSNNVYAAVRAQCPSCRQLSTMQSAQCAADPSKCLVNYGSTQIAQARATCPDDPVFSNPNSPFAQNPVATPIPTTLPGTPSVGVTPSLGTTTPPTVVGALNTPTKTVASTSIPTIVKNTPAKALNASGESPEGVREGALSTAQVATAAATAKATGASSGRSAGASTSIPGFVTASTSSGRGPASDVQGEYGPSLFSSSTQVYQQHCQAQKLNNCP